MGVVFALRTLPASALPIYIRERFCLVLEQLWDTFGTGVSREARVESATSHCEAGLRVDWLRVNWLNEVVPISAWNTDDVTWTATSPMWLRSIRGRSGGIPYVLMLARCIFA